MSLSDHYKPRIGAQRACKSGFLRTTVAILDLLTVKLE